MCIPVRLKLVKSAAASVEVVLAVGFFSGRRCWGPLQSWSLEVVVTPAAWVTLVAPALLPCFQLSLYVSELLFSGWGES